MEHVVQFGVSIDDEAIQRKILDSAEKTIIGDLKREVGKHILQSRYSYGADLTVLTSLGEKLVGEWLDEHKDEVIEAAANKIAEKVSRTKKFKEAVDGIVG